MKCNYCNTQILSTFSYCPSCGKSTRVETQKPVKITDSINVACSSSSNTPTYSGAGQTRLRSFDEFRAAKGRERTVGSKLEESSRFRQKKRKRNIEVSVNIGVMAFDKKGAFKPVRSKYLVVKAWPEYNKWQLLSEAVKKHTNHDRSFTSLSDEWTLVYPDGTEVFSIPGNNNILFTLEAYKNEICKAYNRITLYLANPKDVSTFEASRNVLNRIDSDDDVDMVDIECSEGAESITAYLDADKDVLFQSNQTSTNINNSPQPVDNMPLILHSQLHTMMEIFPGREEKTLRHAISSTSSFEEAVNLIAAGTEGSIHSSYANLCMEDVNNDDLIMSPECCFATEEKETVYCTDKDLHMLLNQQAKKYAGDGKYTRMKVTR